MYVRRGARLHRMLWRERWSLASLVVLAGFTELVDPYVGHLEVFSVVYVGVFSTALSIFLVFRFNEAYERWWEARRLWGAMVNLSRDLARQALSLLVPEKRAELAPTLVRLQIAYPHAVRIRLREGDSDEGRRQTNAVLERLVPEEAAALGATRNVPNAILLLQGRLLQSGLGDTVEGRVLLARFDDRLGALLDVQGGCERIKNTAFPDGVTLVTRVLVWALVVLLMFATLGPDGRDGVVDVVAVCIVSMGYVWIEALGRDLKDPFEGLPNDTPMTSICTTIERDLLEMLGETELPEPVAPQRGVLL